MLKTRAMGWCFGAGDCKFRDRACTDNRQQSTSKGR